MHTVFFFQAEDGIRDLIVTGVQTCAFFFSSRRRHTRSDRDWSSDVCSSDLATGVSSEKLTANTAAAGSSVNGAGGSSDHVASLAGPDTAGFSNSQRFPARHKCALALGKREFRA